MAKLYVWNISTGHNGYQNGYQGWIIGPNSAGGVSVRFSFKNETGKTIKYAYFEFTPYNAVHDAVTCRIKGKSIGVVRCTGPYAAGKVSKNILFENAWYNNSITMVVLNRVTVEYMDGTKEIIKGDDLSFSKPSASKPAVTPSDGSGGCYVATAVYGSYDCPAVWTLRRYRDDTLAATWYGRAFIRTYYAVSPTLVKWFGHTQWFKKMWQGKLDRMVAKLQEQGVESTPYEDKTW